MGRISTHILDTSLGKPAEGVPVFLDYYENDSSWLEVGSGFTDANGRIPNLLHDNIIMQSGLYRITFDTDDYFKTRHIEGFYPVVTVTVKVISDQDYHIPLLLNPFGYSTYRGS
jgi:5-hydroxyisourate hydrolase